MKKEAALSQIRNLRELQKKIEPEGLKGPRTPNRSFSACRNEFFFYQFKVPEGYLSRLNFFVDYE